MNDCIFCKIVAGQIPAHKVYEDDLVLAFLTIEPINPGHTLVIPKEHHSDFHKVPEPFYSAVFSVAKKVATTIETELKPKRVGLLVEGWDVPHAHVHVVPLNNYDDIVSNKSGDSNKPSHEELAEIARKLVN